MDYSEAKPNLHADVSVLKTVEFLVNFISYL